MHRFKTVAAVVFITTLVSFTSAGASTPTTTTDPPPQEEPTTAAPETTQAPPATDPPTPSTDAPEVGTTTTFIDPAITESIIDTTTSIEVTTTNNQVSQDQVAVITATVVGDANSGGNTILDQGPTSTGTAAPAEIGTGDATAIGSEDANIVTQGAEITLQDQAVANVIQVALILNVGIAFANSGYNQVNAAPGAGLQGGIVTGDASAEGLDIDQYITQAAREIGDEDTDAHAGQLAISLWMGLGTANSGTNVISGTGVGGSGGAVGSGNAAATGNISTTDIDQYAELLGEDTATLNVTQRATVLNVGFALANSGINDISGVAGGLLSADPGDDNEYAQDLFAMLLPALLQSYGYGPAAGSISTGNATATGNDSDTFIKQVALAASSGDGVVDIVQQVLVANMGAAGANTGGNSLGGGVATLTPEDASSIVMMAAFMSEMLALVHAEANGATMESVSRGIDVPFQGVLLRLDATFEGLDTTFTDAGGAQANLRQVTIVVSLGLANSNTGHNEAITEVSQGNTVNQLQAGDSVQALALDEAGNVIGTGAAEVDADQLVVICQRINADDIDCLAPPETTTPTPTTTVPGTPTTTPGSPTNTDPGAVAPGGETTIPGAVPTTTTQASSVSSPPVVPHGYVPQGSLPATGSEVVSVVIIVGSVVIFSGGMLLFLSRRKKDIA